MASGILPVMILPKQFWFMNSTIDIVVAVNDFSKVVRIVAMVGNNAVMKIFVIDSISVRPMRGNNIAVHRIVIGLIM